MREFDKKVTPTQYIVLVNPSCGALRRHYYSPIFYRNAIYVSNAAHSGIITPKRTINAQFGKYGKISDLPVEYF